MRIRDYIFKDQSVVLDFHDFHGCTFQKCEMVFHGFGPMTMDGCTFEGCTWTFSGPAANAVQFMTALYAQGGGGKDLIERTFDNIRGRKVP